MHRMKERGVPPDDASESPPEWSADPGALLASGRHRVRRRRLTLLAVAVVATVILTGVARLLG
jgi:hypothetical protein